MIRLLLFACVVACAQNVELSWKLQASESTESLRGIAAVSAQVAWASGAKGTVLRTIDGGETWERVGPSNASDIDFRDIEAFSDLAAVAMSAGEGRASRLYKTSDGGATWALLRTNQDPSGFWDAIGMWDATHGVLVGDPVDGKFTILTTSDGSTWTSLPGPKAEKNEAAFAASGTALAVQGSREAWFATGGAGGGRVFHSEDGGKSWTAARTLIQPTGDGTGIFSIATTKDRIIVVGGDFMKPREALSNIAVSDAGRWVVPDKVPGGYRSAVAYLPARKTWIAVGTSGSDVASDEGNSWRGFDGGAFNAISVARDGTVWAVGPDGRIGKLLF